MGTLFAGALLQQRFGGGAAGSWGRTARRDRALMPGRSRRGATLHVSVCLVAEAPHERLLLLLGQGLCNHLLQAASRHLQCGTSCRTARRRNRPRGPVIGGGGGCRCRRLTIPRGLSSAKLTAAEPDMVRCSCDAPARMVAASSLEPQRKERAERCWVGDSSANSHCRTR